MSILLPPFPFYERVVVDFTTDLDPITLRPLIAVVEYQSLSCLIEILGEEFMPENPSLAPTRIFWRVLQRCSNWLRRIWREATIGRERPELITPHAEACSSARLTRRCIATNYPDQSISAVPALCWPVRHDEEDRVPCIGHRGRVHIIVKYVKSDFGLTYLLALYFVSPV
jgi:hypothetical protein